MEMQVKIANPSLMERISTQDIKIWLQGVANYTVVSEVGYL
jgi:hypothetical protein